MSWGQLRPFATNFAFLACWFRLTVCLFLLTVMAGWIQGVEYYSVHCITLRSLNRRDLRSMADRDRDRRERLKDGETWRLGDWWMESRWLSTHSSAPDAQSKNWAVVSQFSISLSLHSWVTPPTLWLLSSVWSTVRSLCFCCVMACVFAQTQPLTLGRWANSKARPTPSIRLDAALINLHNAVTHSPRAPNTFFISFTYVFFISLFVFALLFTMFVTALCFHTAWQK